VVSSWKGDWEDIIGIPEQVGGRGEAVTGERGGYLNGEMSDGFPSSGIGGGEGKGGVSDAGVFFSEVGDKKGLKVMQIRPTFSTRTEQTGGVEDNAMGGKAGSGRQRRR